MARRSLQASPEGIKKAKRAFQLKEWTQEYLAGEVGLETRQPIWKFFTGKPVDRHIFMELCFQLDLDWQEIADLPQASHDSGLSLAEPEPTTDLDALVQKVRAARWDKIQHQCGTLRLLDIAYPIDLKDIYIDVNILETPTNQRWLEITDLPDANTYDRFSLNQTLPERLPGLQAVEQHPKLMLLGKPGSGKTTFLQYVAIQCNQGPLQAQRVPIFIRLKSFAEDAKDQGKYSLLQFIEQEFHTCGIPETGVVETLLSQGRALILMDGLDEVSEEDSNEVLKQIRQFSEKYYRNSFILTCRLAVQSYQLQGFTEVEVADFNQVQIEAFVKKWFVSIARHAPQTGLEKAAQFLEKLKSPENQQIRELASTPILLNLTCWVFQAKANFPSKRSDLYQQGLNILLVRWDETRGIRRDGIYRNLSFPLKIKLLSYLAAITFEQGSYFFEQEQIQQIIASYLRSLPNSISLEPDALELDSEAVLRAIESQHGLLIERARGIYSFSHLTFQEYFTARSIVSSPTPEALNHALDQLATHVIEPRWREVFLLTVGMLPHPEELLKRMKHYIDQFLAEEAKLQQFLSWLNQKANSIWENYHPAGLRAFFLTLALSLDRGLSRDLSLAVALDSKLGQRLSKDLALDLDLVRALATNLTLTPDSAVEGILALSFACEQDRGLQQALQQLQSQLPDLDQGIEVLTDWWQSHSKTWVQELRSSMIEHRNIGHAWQFSEQQQQQLLRYYQANKLLVDCLHSDCNIRPETIQEIKASLIQPVRVPSL